MIADRHMLVVGQQGIVGPQQLADIGGMMDADIEVGVVADHHRQMQGAVSRRVQHRRDVVFVARVTEQGRQALAQGDPLARRQPQQRVQGRLRRRLDHGGGQVAPDAGQVEDLLADGHADPSLDLTRSREHPQRQVLDGKIIVAVGRGHPAGQSRIVRLIQTQAHRGTLALGKPLQAVS